MATKQLWVRLTDDTFADLKKMADRNGRSYANMLRRLVEQGIEDDKAAILEEAKAKHAKKAFR